VETSGFGGGDEARTWMGGDPGVSGMTRLFEPVLARMTGVVGGELVVMEFSVPGPFGSVFCRFGGGGVCSVMVCVEGT